MNEWDEANKEWLLARWDHQRRCDKFNLRKSKDALPILFREDELCCQLVLHTDVPYFRVWTGAIPLVELHCNGCRARYVFNPRNQETGLHGTKAQDHITCNFMKQTFDAVVQRDRVLLQFAVELFRRSCFPRPKVHVREVDHLAELSRRQRLGKELAWVVQALPGSDTCQAMFQEYAVHPHFAKARPCPVIKDWQ